MSERVRRIEAQPAQIIDLLGGSPAAAPSRGKVPLARGRSPRKSA